MVTPLNAFEDDDEEAEEEAELVRYTTKNNLCDD